MVSISVKINGERGPMGLGTLQYEMTLPVKRVAFFTGVVADLPEWMIDKIQPIGEKQLDIGEVWVGWNKKRSLTIRSKNGYLIVDKGALLIDHGDNVYQVLKLQPVDWGDNGKENSPPSSR